MTWKRLVSDGRAERHKASRDELEGLRALIERNLRDASLSGLSSDNSMALAYEAALISVKMAIACAGYRIKSGHGHHKATFEALPIAMGKSEEPTARLFEGFRRDRNLISYDAAGVISPSDAKTALREAKALAKRVEEWIARKHPRLE